jgi:serine/threonine protein kinase
MTVDLSNQTLDHYRLEEQLGQGGMGSVYRAIDLNLARPVAVKVMHEELSTQPDFQEQFQHEAQAAARLKHPSIIQIYQFGQDEGAVYIVMELIPGLSLGTYIKQLAQSHQVIRLDETLLLSAQIAEALGYAHRKGVVHQDVKPDNILVMESDRTEGPDGPPLRAVITDFGLARLQQGELVMGQGEVKGTLDYMSPEQLLGQPVDGRSDLYSLGVVLYQLATGRPPFEITSYADAVHKHSNEQPLLPHEILPGVPISLGQIIWKAMAKDPADRYQTGDEMAKALRQVAANLGADELDLSTSLDQDSVASMVITLDQDPNLADTSRWLGDEEARPPSYDVLRVVRGSEEPEWYGLQKKNFTIGRSEANDIVLVGGNVSRWHARLEFLQGNWHIIDTGSTNGTFLGKTMLTPDKAYPWRWGQAVHIGPFDLYLQPGIGTGEFSRYEFRTPPTNGEAIENAALPSLPIAPPAELIVADLRPKLIKGMGICRVLLLNEGHASTRVTVAAGDPLGRLRVDAPTKQVAIEAGQKGVVDFYLEGKRPFLGRRQTLPVIMRISSESQEWGDLQAGVKVRPIISIWIFIALILSMVAATLMMYGFINELLPWTPDGLVETIIRYFQGLL